MDNEERREFVESLVERVKEDILSKTSKMPNNWSGFELRRYVADKFEEESFGLLGHTKEEYENEILIKNL